MIALSICPGSYVGSKVANPIPPPTTLQSLLSGLLRYVRARHGDTPDFLSKKELKIVLYSPVSLYSLPAFKCQLSLGTRITVLGTLTSAWINQQLWKKSLMVHKCCMWLPHKCIIHTALVKVVWLTCSPHLASSPGSPIFSTYTRERGEAWDFLCCAYACTGHLYTFVVGFCYYLFMHLRLVYIANWPQGNIRILPHGWYGWHCPIADIALATDTVLYLDLRHRWYICVNIATNWFVNSIH